MEPESSLGTEQLRRDYSLGQTGTLNTMTQLELLPYLTVHYLEREIGHKDILPFLSFLIRVKQGSNLLVRYFTKGHAFSATPKPPEGRNQRPIHPQAMVTSTTHNALTYAISQEISPQVN